MRHLLRCFVIQVVFSLIIVFLLKRNKHFIHSFIHNHHTGKDWYCCLMVVSDVIRSHSAHKLNHSQTSSHQTSKQLSSSYILLETKNTHCNFFFWFPGCPTLPEVLGRRNRRRVQALRPQHHCRTRPDSGRSLRRTCQTGRWATIKAGRISAALAVLLGHGWGGELDQGDATDRVSRRYWSWFGKLGRFVTLFFLF